MNDTKLKPAIALTGTSGYIESRMLGVLQSSGYPVRCLSRNPKYLLHRTDENTEVVFADAQDYKTLLDGLQGIHTVFYFIHSMAAVSDFEELDRTAAQNFSRTVKSCGAKKIVYLGGIINNTKTLSSHLQSRFEVGNIFEYRVLKSSSCVHRS